MQLTTLSQYNKTTAIHHLMGVEGGATYTDYAADSGGKTRFGITEGTANEPQHKALWAKYNWNGDMRTLPGELAFEIYELSWWNKQRLDDILAIHPLLAVQVLDFSVNAGRALAGSTLQRILNVFNLQQKRYNDLKVDGVIGNATLNALRSLVKSVGNDVIVDVILNLQSFQNVHYVTLAEKKESQELFSIGWSRRVKAAILNLAKFVIKI